MRYPDRDTVQIWYCLIVLGIVASYALDQFAGIRFLYSVWISVPAFVLAGYYLSKCLLRSMERSIEAANTPLRSIDLPEIGRVYEYPDGWSIDLPFPLFNGEKQTIEVTIDAKPEGISAHQKTLLRALREEWPTMRPKIEKVINDLVLDLGVATPSDIVVNNETHVHVFKDDAEIDLEILAPDKGNPEMNYIVELKDGAILDVYGAD